MSSDIYVKVQRAGTQIYANVYMQKDNMSAQESSYYGGVAPYMRYQLFTLSNLDIRQQDLLVDNNNIDPITSTNIHYRVINAPENFLDGHCEIVADLVRGK
ncbi:MAG: hypothetical protein PVS3B3_36860 [Ktedonobacteraceae bacterium]